MFHLVAHAATARWLFHDWIEGLELWRRVLELDGLRAAVVMPDHLHVVVRAVDREQWLQLLRGYARWRNHRRGEQGAPVWLPAAPPERISGWKHYRRTLRYIHLNPCRDRLVSDPLAWPLSTHVDFVGLAIPPAVAPDRDPAAFHAYVSGDPSVRVEGSQLPHGLAGLREPTIWETEQAVSALTRTPLTSLQKRSSQRTLLIQSVKALTSLPRHRVAAELRVSPRTVSRTPDGVDGRIALVERALGDRRLQGLHHQSLQHSQAWRAYRSWRERRGAYRLLEESARRRRSRQRQWRRDSD